MTTELLNIEFIKSIFEAQKKNQYAIARTSTKQRKQKLLALKKAIETTYRQDIRDAMMADFRKPQADVDLSEIFPLVAEINHTVKHLSQWIADQQVSTPLPLIGSSSYIKYEPKGVCLIISPWNFPFNLTFGPLISAVAAGNTAILKPSEFTPHSSAVIKKIIIDIFPENEVAVVEGGIETSTNLLELPFNHIFFTGAPSVGKIVMKAAANHLASVTLELGGKSPTIIDDTASIKSAAKRIAWGKFFNCGQICIAPDYVFIHESKLDEFVAALQKVINTFFGENPYDSDSFSLVVNKKHTERIANYLEQSILSGAKVLIGGHYDKDKNYLQPTVVSQVGFDSALMTNEIFGPVLPIITFKTLDEVVDTINQKEKPLALYIYSNSTKNTKFVLDNTRAGGTCINNNDVHFFNSNLPFGGANNSGIGKSHGHFGFLAFSEPRGVYKQHFPGALELLMPPYNKFKEKLIELTVKYF